LKNNYNFALPKFNYFPTRFVPSERNDSKMKFKNEKLEEFERYIINKKVAIIGLGVSNLPLIDYFYNKKSNVTVFDSRELDKLPKDVIEKIKKYKMDIYTGNDYLSKLRGFDLILRSPSCLPTTQELEKEEKNGATVTTEIELLMKMCPCQIIGITGSDGKTTTTTLIYEVLKKAGYNTYVGGNIGTPLFTKLNEILPSDKVVLELSSFQLMGMDVSPDISVITNISPNHLNVHKDYQEYIDAKKNIFKYQNENGILVLNYDDEITRECSKEAKGNVIFISSKQKLEKGFILDGNIIKECEDNLRKHIADTKDFIIKGVHNYEHICATLAVTKGMVNSEKVVDILKTFKGVEHRLEFVREIDGVKWYNDSASTSPSRLINALNAFNEDVVLIAGGADKNLDYTPVAKPILDKVKTLILIGQTAGKIFESVKQEEENQKKEISIYMAKDLQEAINIAKKYGKQIVLFSPASTSFDMFKSMYERGEIFKDMVNNLK